MVTGFEGSAVLYEGDDYSFTVGIAPPLDSAGLWYADIHIDVDPVGEFVVPVVATVVP